MGQGRGNGEGPRPSSRHLTLRVGKGEEKKGRSCGEPKKAARDKSSQRGKGCARPLRRLPARLCAPAQGESGGGGARWASAPALDVGLRRGFSAAPERPPHPCFQSPQRACASLPLTPGRALHSQPLSYAASLLVAVATAQARSPRRAGAAEDTSGRRIISRYRLLADSSARRFPAAPAGHLRRRSWSPSCRRASGPSSPAGGAHALSPKCCPAPRAQLPPLPPLPLRELITPFLAQFPGSRLTVHAPESSRAPVPAATATPCPGKGRGLVYSKFYHFNLNYLNSSVSCGLGRSRKAGGKLAAGLGCGRDMYSGLAPQGPAVFPRREGPARAGRCRSDAGVPVVREDRTGPWMVVLLEAGLREDSPQPREGGGQGGR